MKSRTVLEAKRLGIVSCRGSDRLDKIAARMADDDISALVVTDSAGYLSGVISRSDVLRAYVESPDWRTEPVEQFMTRQVVWVTPDTRLSEAAQMLLGRHIHRVVVVRQEEGGMRPIAVLSDSDLVCDMVSELQTTADDASLPQPPPIRTDEIVACLKRVGKSVQYWTKEGGRRGYLTFVEEYVS